MAEILLHDECQLLDWGESRTTGPWIKLRLVDPEQLDVFRGMDIGEMKRTGHILNLTLSRGDIIPAPEPVEKPFGDMARELYLSGFFYARRVWKAIGPDADFLAWIREQKCCARGGLCGGAIEAAHVRRVADGAGTGIKPEYSAVPLCHNHHAEQHARGESALGGKEWFDQQRNKHVHDWAWARCKQQLGVTSMAEAEPGKVWAWAWKRDLADLLPSSFLGADEDGGQHGG